MKKTITIEFFWNYIDFLNDRILYGFKINNKLFALRFSIPQTILEARKQKMKEWLDGIK